MAAPTVFIAVARDQNGNVIFPATAVTNDCNNNFEDLFRKAATVSSVEVRNSLVYIVPMVDTIPDVHNFGHPVQKYILIFLPIQTSKIALIIIMNYTMIMNGMKSVTMHRYMYKNTLNVIN